MSIDEEPQRQGGAGAQQDEYSLTQRDLVKPSWWEYLRRQRPSKHPFGLNPFNQKQDLRAQAILTLFGLRHARVLSTH
ncbi:hypothetical protein MY4824_000535 [Beauveria thailandica]